MTKKEVVENVVINKNRKRSKDAFGGNSFQAKRSKDENSATVLTPSNHEPTKTNHGTKDVILKKKKKHRPGDDSKKIEDKHHLPESKLTNSENDLPKKKKKRPWRAHVRREAKKARLAEERAEREANGEVLPEPTQPSTDGNLTAKKKKNKKKKKKNKIPSTMPEAAIKKEVGSEKPKINSVSEKLEASRFRYLNEQLYTSTGADAEKLFAEDPEAFEAYHRGYRIQVLKWPTNPLDIIIRDSETLPTGSIIADLGCGEAKLAEKLESKYTIHSYDLAALNHRVVACNIAKLPLENETVDLAVFCLSLMGSNLSDYIREAHRILKKGGKLKIAEVTSRFRNLKNFILALEKMGFQLKRKKELESYFTLLTLEKIGKITEKRPKGLILDPCLYKKR